MNESAAVELEIQDVENVETESENESEQVENKQENEISKLRAEIETLRAELRVKKDSEKAQSRILNELAEFGEYFPDVDYTSIPDEIWERVRKGSSLASSYALFLRRSELDRKKVDDFNEKNRRMSAGSLMKGEGEKYYSPAEVKKMTPAQVKSNYDDIIASMRHWN